MIRSAPAKEVLEGGRLKGGIFRSHLAWVKDQKGDAALQQVLQRLDPDAARALSGAILVSSWFPFKWLMQLDRAVVDLFGNGNVGLLSELGRYSARLNLSTTYRAFDRDTNHDFFRNSALLHSQFQDFGDASYVQSGEKSGKMMHSNYRAFSPFFCASALGYYEGCITSHGAQHAFVEETECQCYGDKSCTFEMKWV